jgi:hypothetical protein
MVLNHCFTFFLHFPWPINYNHTSRRTKFSTHLSPNWFWSKTFSFIWIHGIAHDYVLHALSCTNEWRTTLKVVHRFDTDLTTLWWRSWTAKSAPLFQNQTFLSLILSNFFELFYLGDFVVGWPRFLTMNLKLSVKVLWNWRHFNFSMVFNS